MTWTNGLNNYSSISAPTRDATSNARALGIDLVRAGDVKPKNVARLWNGRFYRGKLGFIAGEPGLGKSLMAIHMAATVSTGGHWPSGEGTARLGDVIYISAEDGAADTVRPRLEAAGADLDRVHLVEAVKDDLGLRPFSLVSDLGRLDQSLEAICKPRLVIIDPSTPALVRLMFVPSIRIA